MTVDKLYACFTDAELERLRQIKSDPRWTPNKEIAKASPLYDDDYVQMAVYVRRHLHTRLKARCQELGISIREYVNAVLEVMLS